MAKRNNSNRRRNGDQPQRRPDQVVPLPVRPIFRGNGAKVRATSGGVVVAHRELLTTVVSESNTQTPWGFHLNPATALTWGKNVATLYAYYRWRKLRVIYTGNCPTTTSGHFACGTFYRREDLESWGNLANTSVTSRLMNTDRNIFGPVWGGVMPTRGGSVGTDMSFELDVSTVHQRTNWCTVDPSANASELANQSICVYLGYLASPNGSAVSVYTGNIWIEYEIEFIHSSSGSPNVPTVMGTHAVGGGGVVDGNGRVKFPTRPPDTPVPDPTPEPPPAPAPQPDPKPDDP